MSVRDAIACCLLGLALLVPTLAAAQTPGCALGTAGGDLATSDLTARVYNTGSLFYGGSTTNGDGYFVPRARARSPIFAAGLWVGGRVNGSLRVAAARYTNFNFWPGPLDPGGTLPNPTDCSVYDRIYVVTPGNISDYEAGRGTAPDLADWPVGLGARTVDAAGQPVVPTSRAQTIDLAAGERPVLYGGPTAFWVMNDAGQAIHPGTGTAPLGIEVRVTAALPYTGPEALRQATVYRYEVVNRNSVPLTDLRIGFFADPDLGFAGDDYVGTDVARGLAYVYNADTFDEGAAGYGIPPAFGFDMLSGLGASTYFINGGPPTTTGDPTLAAPIYNFLQGLWGDGSFMSALGDGYNQSPAVPITRFMFTGNPVAFQPWSEINNGTVSPANLSGDRRFVASAAPLTLAPGASHTVDLALVFAQGTDYLDSVTELGQASDLVQNLYDAGILFSGVYTPAPPAPAATTLLAPAPDADFNTTRPPSLTFSWTPAAGAEAYRLELSASPTFDAPIVGRATSATELTLPIGELPAHDGPWTYWRVTPTNLGGDGPTTEARRFAFRLYPPVFTSFEVVANSAGPLVPPQPGALADAGFPTPGGANPASGVQQAGNPSQWLLHTWGNYATYAEWLARVTRDGLNDSQIFPFDYEMRFTGSSLAAVRGRFNQDSTDIIVPFELWNTGSGTPGDPSDDVRLIPVLLEGVGGVRDGAFGLIRGAGGVLLDSPVSPGDDDPYTDGVYWYNPVDMSPGTVGYDAYLAARTSDPTDNSQIGDEVFARTVLVSWNGSTRVGSFPLPQPGTVFRIWGSGPSFVADEPGAETAALSLGVYPNPVSGTASVPYVLPAASDVRLSVMDVLGREVAVLAEGPQAAGPQMAAFDATGLAAGVYMVVLRTDDARVVRRLTVLR